MFLWQINFRNAGISLAFLLMAGTAASETVTGQKFLKDFNGYHCYVTLNTEAGEGLTLQLSDYKDVWHLIFGVDNRADVFRKFFDSHGLRDARSFESAFRSVKIGDRDFDFDEATLFEVQRKDVDQTTTGIFEIKEQHNVAQILSAMTSDGIAIPGLIDLDGTTSALSEFRSCSYAAMGLREGEQIEMDFRAEYRMIFERSFETWVSSMAKAEQCLDARYDDAAVEEVIDAAADAFYPGVFNFRKRSAYREDLEGKVPLAKLTGITNAGQGCLMAGRLAEASRIPVDRAIKSAADLD